jgi:anti-sigma factor RsiW
MSKSPHDENDEGLSRLVREQATRHRASAELLARVRTSVALADAGRQATGVSGRRWSWASAAAGFAAGLVLTGVLFFQLWRMSAPASDPLVAALVAEHVRALAAGPLIQVASSDRHSVKPWFQGRIDFAPPVLDLAGEGFVLQGGRVERVQGATMAVLVYRLRQHVVELYIWPSDTPAVAGQEASRRGFQLRAWTEGDMRYALLSDADRAELDRFARAWQEHLPPH